MQRFIITSPKFTGTAEIWYNFEGMLCYINLNECIMDYEQIKYLLNRISPDVTQFMALRAGSTLEIKQEPFEITLEDFKREYPYSRNYHLLPAYWATMNKKERVIAFFAAIQYRKHCERNNIKPPFIRIAATWLSKKEYLNDWRKM